MADDPMYHDGMRRLQDARDTRRIAERLEQVTVRTAFTEEDRLFIGNCAMFFVATADAGGRAVAEAAAGTIRRTPALRVSADSGAAATGRLAGQQC